MGNLGEITETNFDSLFKAFITAIQNATEKYVSPKRLSQKERKLKNKP